MQTSILVESLRRNKRPYRTELSAAHARFAQDEEGSKVCERRRLVPMINISGFWEKFCVKFSSRRVYSGIRMFFHPLLFKLPEWDSFKEIYIPILVWQRQGSVRFPFIVLFRRVIHSCDTYRDYD